MENLLSLDTKNVTSIYSVQKIKFLYFPLFLIPLFSCHAPKQFNGITWLENSASQKVSRWDADSQREFISIYLHGQCIKETLKQIFWHWWVGDSPHTTNRPPSYSAYRKRIRQKRSQRSSLLFEEHTSVLECRTSHLTRMIWRNAFGRMVVWCSVNWKIIHFYPFRLVSICLEIILALNL